MTAQRSQTTGPARAVSVRLTDAERAQLDRVCGRLGLSRSAVIRGGIDALDADGDGRRGAPAPRLPRDPALVDAAVALRMEVHRIGVNLNQLTRRVHQGDTGALADLRAVVDELSLSAQALHRLGQGGEQWAS